MRHILTAATGLIVATHLGLAPALAAWKDGPSPRCPDGWTFVQEISAQKAKKLSGGKSCDAGFTNTYWVCPEQKQFKVRCLTAEDLEAAESK